MAAYAVFRILSASERKKPKGSKQTTLFSKKKQKENEIHVEKKQPNGDITQVKKTEEMKAEETTIKQK